MAVDVFLKIEPVKGEATDDKHKDEIEVLSWSFGAHQTGGGHTTGGLGTGKVNVSDIHFTHLVDKASADLFLACCTGKHFDKALLTVRKAGGDNKALEYLKYTLEHVFVTSVQTQGTGHGGEHANESVSLNFKKVTVEYTPQTEKGAAGASSKHTFDVQANKAS